MTAAGAYPEPGQDLDNRRLLEGWREGKLFVQHCRDCGRRVFYPRPMCPGCWSPDLEWVEVPGEGRVVSFTRIHRPNDPSFFDEVPIVFAEIRLAGGASLLARMVCDDPSAVHGGMEVELVALPAARRYPLPTFRPKQKKERKGEKR